jgi:sensor histidine kinase regulating citrate/malate metabolism
MRRIHVVVQADHIKRLCKAKNPVTAIAELIWNALDADATHVEVVLRRNECEGIDQIQVRDDGNGIRFDEVENLFANLGGSWKSNTGPADRRLMVVFFMEDSARVASGLSLSARQ